MPLSLPLLLLSLARAEPWIDLDPGAFSPALDLPPAVVAGLQDRDHAAAARALVAIDRSRLPGAQLPDLVFVTAWELLRAGRGAEAAKMADAASTSANAPPAYLNLLIGEARRAEGRHIEAIGALERVPPDGPIGVRARLALAESYLAAERTSDARAVWEALAARPDPAPGSAVALGQLAGRSKDAAPYIRRLYRSYPGTAEDRAHPLASPTVADVAARGDTLQEKGDFGGAVALLGARLAEAKADDCVYRYALGRAQHKASNLTAAITVLEPLGKACATKDPDRAARALYLAGRSYERKKQWADAARMYAAIPRDFPAHSMADDGYALGGVALQVAGDLAGARELWARAVAAYPTGDLAAESAWRLCWAAALSGDTAGAIRWADEAVATIPLASAPTDVLASMYWSGRLRAWPDVENSSVKAVDPGAAKAAADRLEAVAQRAPWHFYGALAAARLAQLDAGRAARLARPAMDGDGEAWRVRGSFAESPAVKAAMGLAKLGLLREALAELASLDTDGLTGAEMATIIQVEAAAGDFLVAHDRLRTWLQTRPPDSLGPNAWRVMRVAYPNQYWPEVQAAASYGWDPRVFHALVREESNFNPNIKSHAGACGLSQLMPGTAKGCAKRMGLAFASGQIWDPAVNLKIGAWYLDTLHARYHGNSMLALAGYNAGEGNADRWVAGMPPNAPSDAVIESIDFRETRHYVKRVLSTYQTYRLLYGTADLFPAWVAVMDDAVP